MPKIYVITHHNFNHVGENRLPLDQSFLNKKGRYVFYLIDKERPEILAQEEVIQETQLDRGFHEAGGKFFGEWSFLLAEEKYQFCSYPFFMISSRFYEKNRWIYRDLNQEWDTLFSHFNTYKWGYLPSYDRPFRFIDTHHISKPHRFFPLTDKAVRLTESLYQFQFRGGYRYISDYFCNYIGFRDRASLLEYLSFYRPVLDFFFDAHLQPKVDLSDYVKKTGDFRNEKPFTFYLEFFSHLFFFKGAHPFFGLHYDGYYEINEKVGICKKISSFPLPSSLRLRRLVEWKWKQLKTEGVVKWAILRAKNRIKRKLRNPL